MYEKVIRMDHGVKKSDLKLPKYTYVHGISHPRATELGFLGGIKRERVRLLCISFLRLTYLFESLSNRGTVKEGRQGKMAGAQSSSWFSPGVAGAQALKIIFCGSCAVA